jgi:LPXTG-motif cell wall-anchored protein
VQDVRVVRGVAAVLVMSVVALGLMGSPASAAIERVVDTPTGGYAQIDGAVLTRPIEVTSAGPVTDVSIMVDFGARDDGTQCLPFAPGTGSPFFNEMDISLTSPSGVQVVLVEPFVSFVGGSPGSGVRAQMTFADSGATLPTTPRTGTFAPAEPLSEFVGEPAEGDWTLAIRDYFPADPKCYYGAELVVETGAQAPVATDTSVSTPFDTPLDVTLPATDGNDDPLTYTVDGVGGIGGTVTCDPVGGPSCTYTPPAGDFGTATIGFTASDGALSDSGTVTVDVEAPVPAALVVTPSTVEVDQGGSVTLTAETTTASGFTIEDVTADVLFTSDVATDVIAGNTVTFPTASPHTITATHASTGLTDDVVIEVRPADAGETPSPEPPTSDDPISGDPASEDPASGAATSRALPDTGGPATGWLAAAGLALVAGVGLMVVRTSARVRGQE